LKVWGWLQSSSQSLAPGQPLNIILVSAADSFSSLLLTQPDVQSEKDVAENPKKSGAFISWHPPGEQSGPVPLMVC